MKHETYKATNSSKANCRASRLLNNPSITIAYYRGINIILLFFLQSKQFLRYRRVQPMRRHQTDWALAPRVL